MGLANETDVGLLVVPLTGVAELKLVVPNAAPLFWLAPVLP